MYRDIGRDRHRAVQAAQQLIAERPVYLDTETTGLDSAAQIVEVSILDYDGRVLIDTLVRPTVSIPSEAARIHGITDARVRGAPSWAEVWREVAAALEGRQVAIYNASFDARLMRQSHQAHALAWRDPSAGRTCVMELFAQYHGQWSEFHGSYTWQSLERARSLLRLPLSNSHRAADDARLAREVLHAIAAAEK